MQLAQNFYNCSQMETSGPAQNLLLKLHAKIMPDVSDKLINWQMKIIDQIKTDSLGEVKMHMICKKML